MQTPLNPSAEFLQWLSKLESAHTVAVTAGTLSLVLTKHLHLPFVHIGIGSDVGIMPILGAALRLASPYRIGSRAWCIERLTVAKYSRRVRVGLERATRIMEAYPYNIRVLERLGLARKMLEVPFPIDVAHDQALVNAGEVDRLTSEYEGCELVFMWLSRLNLTPEKKNLYKGPERFLAALEANQEKILDGSVRVVIGRHGNDAEAFAELARSTAFHDRIEWVSHLDRKALLALLSVPNAVIFSEFSPHHDVISGLGRDALIARTMWVCGTTPESTRATYGSPSPNLYALSTDEISRQMRHLIAASVQERAAMREAMERFARLLDFRTRFLPAFVQVLRDCHNSHGSIAA